ncbi:MAG: thiol peroxidase [Chitinophagaceae bacterium]|nr:thiol peroxidase [Chitinophagaceae bacterium]
MTRNLTSVSTFKFLFSGLIGLLIASGCFAQNSSTDTMKKMSTTENTNGTTITLGGKPIHTSGKLPALGTQVKDFTLTGVDLAEKNLAAFKGKYIIMNIFPSVNTGVCSKSVRKFNQDAAGLNNTTVLCISKDLPFAQKQFCGAEGIDKVVMLSDFRNNFGITYGVQITDGPMKGLLSRAVIVVDPTGKIVYEQHVPEIGREPDYASAIAAIK